MKSLLASTVRTSGQATTVSNGVLVTSKTYRGTITNIGDRFKFVLNEQVVKGGTITVNAAHLYLLGPTAVGDLIIGQPVCGLR